MISVIMSIYKEKKEVLEQAILSIINQTYKNFEFIIVVDNPDNGDAISVLNYYADLDDRIRVIVNKENIGLALSLNVALSKAHGEFIARMDADDIAAINRLEEQYRYLNENDLDLIGSFYEQIGENGEIIKIIREPQKDIDIRRILKYRNCIAHPTFFCKKDLYDCVKGYNNIAFCEDYLFLLKLKEKKIKFGNCPKVLLRYRLTPNGISRKNIIQQQLRTYYLSNYMGVLSNITERELKTYDSSKQGEKIKREIMLYYEIKELMKSKKVIKGFAKLAINFWDNDFLKYMIKGKLLMHIMNRG